MNLRSRRLFAVLAASVLTTATFAISVPAQATPNVCHDTFGFGAWTSEQDMVDASGGYCRSTFVDDPGQGNLLSRQRLINSANLFWGRGFSRQWLWYARESTLHVPSGSPLRWQGCEAVPQGNPAGGSECISGQFFADAITGVFDQNPVDLDVFSYDGRFIARPCGNNSVDIAGSDPVPSITGAKFDDRNHNAQRDPGEAGVAGVTFQLIRQSSAYGDQGTGLVASRTSDSSGNFSFPLDGQGPGVYTVHEVVPAGSISTTGADQNVTVDAGIGSDSVGNLQFGNRPEQPPVANAGPDQSLDQTTDAGTPVVLDGTGSSDADGDPLTYSWTGPFDAVSGATATVNLPVGTNTVTLTVSDGIETSTDTMQVTVYPPITATRIDQQTVEGSQLSSVFATFTDPDPAGQADEYQATVDWGDGMPSSPGVITRNTDGSFAVTGLHTYLEEGSYQAQVTIADVDNSYNTEQVADSVTVADAPLTAAGVDDFSTNPVDRTVATFVDANPSGDLADFTATVDWGDGSAPTAGVISGSPGGTFSVGGSHRYATLGPKTITVQVVDDGGSQATAVSHLLLYAFPASGNFVVGDLNAGLGNAVTFWGAQWWKLNALSGGSAPAAFKGYADGSTTTGWTAGPGNSANPVDSVPSYLAVLVTGSATQSGSLIAGDAPHVVIVATDPGYRNDPGHAGTGTVVGVLR